jgi:NAD dependent epimerase/dehydratase family
VFVVGAHGYVGVRVMIYAADADGEGSTVPEPVAVTRSGTSRGDVASLPWSGVLESLRSETAPAVVWLLDGARDNEVERLQELVAGAPGSTHVVMVSTCTVYGDRGGDLCDERSPLQLITGHAQVKVDCERTLAESGLTWCSLRLGALYGIDDRPDRGERRDRVETWTSQARSTGQVVVPDPKHWRGWLHRDQAARALVRAARKRVEGIINVASSNMTFGQAADLAAAPWGAAVVGSDAPDPCDYRVDAATARTLGLLDEATGENLADVVTAFASPSHPTIHHRGADGQPE